MNNQQYNVITGKRFYTESDGAVNAFRVVHVWHEGKIECIDEANGTASRTCRHGIHIRCCLNQQAVGIRCFCWR